TTAALMVKHINDKMPHPQSLRPELSDGLCLILSRLTARDCNDRYENLDDAAADFEDVARGGVPSCRPLPPAKSKFLPGPATEVPGRGERLGTRRVAPVTGSTTRSGLAPVGVRDTGRRDPVTRESRRDSSSSIRPSARKMAAQNASNKWIGIAG